MKKLILIVFGILLTHPSFAFYFSYEYEGQTLMYTTLDINRPPMQAIINDVMVETTNTNLSGELIIPDTFEFIGCKFRVVAIRESGFRNCDKLTSVTIPNSLKTVGDYAFFECRSLTSVTIPSSVTTIGDYAFSNCRSLTSVMIPSSVTTINQGVFSGCSVLSSVTIPGSVTSIGNFAFSYCSSLTSVTIPSSVKSIGGAAFIGCNALTSATIPASVTSIGISSEGEPPFAGCSNLTQISVDQQNEYYCSIEGVLFNKKVTTLINYPGGKEGEYVIPASVTELGSYSFYDCCALTSIKIPETINSIGNYVFSNCKSLTSIVIPGSVTEIGSHAFDGCSGLISVTIPESVTTIGDFALSSCSCD